MSLIDLPEEILVIIIKQIDLKSVYSLYYTCNHLKDIICKYNVIKTGALALSTMATAQFFKHNFMKDISRHLRNLDLRGVTDLSKTSLLTAVGRMKYLQSLDVSYTNITIIDLVEVYKSCPTIINIACNFVFGKKNEVTITQDNLIESQNLFQNFNKVHLIGNAGNLIYSNLALLILQKAHLSELQFTVVENQGTVYQQREGIEEDDINVQLKFISIYVLNEWRINNPGFGSFLSIPSVLRRKDKYEFIAIINLDCGAHIIYVSPIFKNFFIEYFNIESKCVYEINFLNYVANAAVMLWNKLETVFNESFFKELKTKLVDLFPHYIKDVSNAVPEQFDNFFLSLSSEDIKCNVSTNLTGFKKRRLAPSPYNLDYDKAFEKKKKVQLTLFFQNCVSRSVVVLSSNQYLRKLTYLSLTGTVRYSGEFFNVLFRCCDQLETLNVEVSSNTTCASSIARNIPLCQSIKNFRLVDGRIDFKILLSSLSHCCILENIHIMDVSQENNKLGNPSTLFEKCRNLYCLFILAPMSSAARAKRFQLFKELKDRYSKNYMHLQLCTEYIETKYNYDPYLEVFKLNSIKPIEKLF